MECDISLQCFDTVGRQEGHLACKKLDVGLLVGGDDLTGSLHDLYWLQLSPPPPSSFASMNTCSPGKWPLNGVIYWSLLSRHEFLCPLKDLKDASSVLRHCWLWQLGHPACKDVCTSNPQSFSFRRPIGDLAKPGVISRKLDQLSSNSDETSLSES